MPVSARMSQQEMGFLLGRLRQHEAKLSKQVHVIDRNTINTSRLALRHRWPVIAAICSPMSSSSHLASPSIAHFTSPLLFRVTLLFL